MDEVLREALVLPDVDAVFGPRKEGMEYVGGELKVFGPLASGLVRPGEPAPIPGHA
jgi:hypothetical protein